MVLVCEDFHISHSLRKRLKQMARAQSLGDLRTCVVTVNCAFEAVLEGCATRGDVSQHASTWITPHMLHAYQSWHQQGRVHSIETWQNGELVGGLYGVSMGATFFGESMFTRATDASKIALAHLVKFLKRHGVNFIDCQMVTNHLSTLGAHPIDRADFIQLVALGIEQNCLPWQAGWLNSEGEILPKSALLALPFEP
jgi:leucyl/phenylalanyl-tRNA--protein transferase